MRSVVVAPQPRAAEAGAEVLRRGGNAFDAAVAAGFMQMATDPLMCGIGGMGIAQVHVAATGETLVLDFLHRAGSRYTPDLWEGRVREAPGGKRYVEGFPEQIGYQTIMRPGSVAGFGALHARWGSRDWAELLQPAIGALREGFPMDEYIADFLDERHQYGSSPASPPLDAFLRASEPMAALWLDDEGRPRRVGDHLANPDYARTLERLAADGADSFYRGALAQEIAADLAAHDALVTAADLAGYQVIDRRPLAGSYRGLAVSTVPAPGGGPTLLQILGILEGFDLAALGHDSVEYLHLLLSAMRLAFADRKEHLGDPDFVDDATARLLDPAHIAALRERVERGELASAPEDGVPGTTHLTVADAAGNVVAVTHTLGHGSGVITPGLGFQYNGGGGFDLRPGRPNSAAPGKVRLSGMCPTIVLRDGAPAFALGSPGSNAIVNAVAQVIINTVDFGMSPVEAVSAPRAHGEGEDALLETRIPQATARALAERGHAVTYRPFAYDTLQGRIQLVARTPDGDWAGASDPRRQGGYAAYA
ncbi:MAG TPA: gamma-glutamyltransferase [Thermomicrobiales bacterium]|nr:gamma-glutamyltransferase [Thermomicrobiales bacterium]